MKITKKYIVKITYKFSRYVRTNSSSKNNESERGEKKFMLREVAAAARNEHVENVQHKKQIYKCCVHKIFPALLLWFSWEQFIFNSRFLSRTAFPLATDTLSLNEKSWGGEMIFHRIKREIFFFSEETKDGDLFMLSSHNDLWIFLPMDYFPLKTRVDSRVNYVW